jgi:hypothetical protein
VHDIPETVNDKKVKEPEEKAHPVYAIEIQRIRKDEHTQLDIDVKIPVTAKVYQIPYDGGQIILFQRRDGPKYIETVAFIPSVFLETIGADIARKAKSSYISDEDLRTASVQKVLNAIDNEIIELRRKAQKPETWLSGFGST